MLGKFLAAVDEPELVLVALHPNLPETIKTASFELQWSVLNINKGFSADGQKRDTYTVLTKKR